MPIGVLIRSRRFDFFWFFRMFGKKFDKKSKPDMNKKNSKISKRGERIKNRKGVMMVSNTALRQPVLANHD